MVDIQSPTTEIRRGKKIEDRNHSMKIWGGHKEVVVAAAVTMVI